jgi:hypothetical protein
MKGRLPGDLARNISEELRDATRSHEVIDAAASKTAIALDFLKILLRLPMPFFPPSQKLSGNLDKPVRSIIELVMHT